MGGNEKRADPRDEHRPTLTGPAIFAPKELFRSQLTILKRVLIGIYDFAEEEAKKEVAATAYRLLQRERHPHQVFLIDGARGSGKTSLLLTIQRNLRYLGRPRNWGPHAKDGGRETPSEELLAWLGPLKNEHPTHDGTRQTAFYLPVLFPSDLEMGQSIMEGLLALMIASIDEFRKHKESIPDTDFERWKKKADTLVRRANQEVAQGWFLSKNAGTDAILRDSADYKDYLRKRGEANVASFGRVVVWRHFVNDFLDFFRSELLVVFFDDTDVALETTRDILHTMRIFLDHPRIVTVVAANLHAMRQSVLLDGMRELGSPMEALRNEATATAHDWRRFVRRQIEEYLEKVLPRPYRQYIQVDQGPANIRRAQVEKARDAGQVAPDNAGKCGPAARENVGKCERAAPATGANDSDFRKIFNVDNFDYLCGMMLNRTRDDFIETKHKAYFRSLDDCQEIADEEERTALENYIAWWTLRHWYAEALRPRSARHMNALRTFAALDPKKETEDDDTSEKQHKRLAVILSESPDNYELIQRFGDEDKRVLLWLRRQKIQSTWHDQRYLVISERSIHEKTYSYYFLFFRVDLGIAMPVHENVDETPPRGFLPEPDGPNLVGFRGFSPGKSQSRLFGVARDLHHTLIPANCIYLADLDALPDIAWKATTQEDARDAWGRDMNYKWPDYFFFDVDETLHSDPEWAGRNRPDAVKDVWVKNYFVEIVLPMASIAVGQFTRPSEAESGLLKSELASNFFDRARGHIDRLRRRVHYMETLGASLKDSRGVANLAAKLLQDWDETVLLPMLRLQESGYNIMPLDADLALLGRHLVDYRWLVNDVRRAWHAARIFLNQISDTLRKRSSRESSEPPEAAHIRPETSEITRRDHFFRGDKYTVATRQAFDRWLTRSDTLTKFVAAVEGPYTGEKIPEKTAVKIPDGAIGLKEGISPSGDKVYEIDKGWLREAVEQDIKAIVKYGRSGNDGNDVNIPLSPEDLKFFLTTRSTEMQKGQEWPLIIDPGLHDELKARPGEDQSRLKLSAHDSRTNERLSRSLLLFFYGVSPTMPALIHIEVASSLRKPDAATPNFGAAKSILNDWEQRVRRHLLFVQRYRRAHEITKIRLDLMLLWRRRHQARPLSDAALLGLGEPSASNFAVRATLTPDMSFSSLGIDGIRLFAPSRVRPNPLSAQGHPSPDPNNAASGQDGMSVPNSPSPGSADTATQEGEYRAFFDGSTDGDLKDLADDLRNMQARWNRVYENSGRMRWRSLIETTIDHLIETLNFIEATRKVLSASENFQAPATNPPAQGAQ